jgi:hypothetical protein
MRKIGNDGLYPVAPLRAYARIGLAIPRAYCVETLWNRTYTLILDIEIHLSTKNRGLVTAHYLDEVIAQDEPFKNSATLRQALRLRSLSDWIAVHHTFLAQVRRSNARAGFCKFSVPIDEAPAAADVLFRRVVRRHLCA